MLATHHLALINVFTGDIQGGLGPFLGTWLAEAASWSPSRIGFVTTLVGIGSLLLSGPFGALVDRLGLDGARAECDRLVGVCEEAVASWGDKAETLRQAARFTVARKV